MNCILQSLIAPKVAKHGPGYIISQMQRDGIYRELILHRTLFTHFKTNTKTIGIYRLLECCVLLKNQNLVSNEMGQAILRPQISTNDVRSIYSISLNRYQKTLCKLKTSVTRRSNKKQSKCFQKLPKKKTKQFSLKAMFFKISQKSTSVIWATFVRKVVTKRYENSPIWSHC